MAGIWANRGEGWELGSPQAFRDEAALHRLIEQNPQLLPLAGSPSPLSWDLKYNLGAALRTFWRSSRPADPLSSK